MNIYKKNPPNWSYDSIRTELLYFEKLKHVRPENLDQANRISGVNPSDINVLMVILSKSHKKS